MEQKIGRIQKIFEAGFPGATAELEYVKPLRKVGGFLIWDGFQGVEQLKRQRALSRALKEGLEPKELAQVTTILTITPGEAEAMKEAASAD
jgi:acid stress-induced BolA-like protein IbaG/YrbA